MLKELPQKALTNLDLSYYAKKFGIRTFRGVFSIDNLPFKHWSQEAGIINLHPADKGGSHWTAYRINKDSIIFYDSFGNINPPQEFIRYVKDKNIQYNRVRDQKYNSVNCGHLCLKFLIKTNII